MDAFGIAWASFSAGRCVQCLWLHDGIPAHWATSHSICHDVLLRDPWQACSFGKSRQ